MTAVVGKSISQRMSAADRKQQIVEVAARMFAEKGFKGTTTKELASGAGVSEAIIFRHFPSKRALYSAIIDHKTKEGAARIIAQLKEAETRKDDRELFTSFAFEVLEAHRRDHTLTRLLLFSALEGHELSEIFYHSTAREVRSQLERYIKRRIADGAFRRVDPALCARAFLGIVVYHAQSRILYKNENIKLSSRQLADRFVDMFLNGLSAGSKSRGRDV